MRSRGEVSNRASSLDILETELWQLAEGEELHDLPPENWTS